MWITTEFTSNGVGVTGLLPVIIIRDLEDNSVVVSGTMSEIGDGFYAHNFFSYDMQKDYAILCDSVTLPTAIRYNALATGEYGNRIDNVHMVSDNIDVRALLLRKIMTNKQDVLDGESNNQVLYDDDSVTELLKWNATDKNNEYIKQLSNDVSGRSKGT